MTVSYAYAGSGHELDIDAAWDYIRDGYLLAPRTVLKGRTKIAVVALPQVSVELRNIPSVAEETLKASLGNIVGYRRAVMFSGGFDSMLLGMLAQEGGALVTAVTVRFDDFNPITLTEAVSLAQEMDLPHHILHVTIQEFVAAFELLAGLTDEPLLDLDLAAVYVALKKYNRQVAGEVFISGMGSDQWFGNHSLEEWPGGLAGRLDWTMLGGEAHQQVAQVHGCKFVFPFLSAPMLALSQQIPPVLKKNKKLLHSLATRNVIHRQGTRTEIQIPPMIRRILVKVYGHRAWPKPISILDESCSLEQMRQIVLGLWLEKAKNKVEVYE